MADTSNQTARNLHVGDVLHGFRVERIEDLPEIDGRAVVMRHDQTGTPLMWLANEDENKSFSVTFKTPPVDNTGVFHILEHSVLCGSDQYPVKEPFVNLLKTSMQTFLNALTFSDKTMYPVASTNERDLMNLMSVYLDAVLFPQLYHKRAIFEQEGWHYEVEGEGTNRHLVTNGVVLNEMRGAMSDPDEVALAGLNAALFPDTAYGYESGGNPAAIPNLTYESYLDTHARHYNMANSRIVLYGDIALMPELELIASFIDKERQSGRAAGSANPLELQAPVVRLDVHKEMQTSPDNACVTEGFVIGTFRDRTRVLACEILCDALMGSNEAPLKRAILESDLGCDVDCFVYDGLLQPYVVIELRGARAGAAGELTELLKTEFSRMAREGVPRAELSAALDAADFSLRERDSGMADGVALAINAMCGWLYDDEMPCDYLRYEDSMRTLREGLTTTFWEDTVRDIFVDTNHHGRCELIALEEDEREAEQDQADTAEEVSPQQLDDVERAANELHRIQDEPDSPEALATLPRLHLCDVGQGPTETPLVLAQDTPLPCAHYALDTRRIDYTYHYFPLDDLAWDELCYVTLACSLLGKMATTSHSAAELDLLVESRLGRLGFSTHVTRREDTGQPCAWLVVGACALSENVIDLAELPAHVWSQTVFDDTERIRTVLTQQKLDAEQAFANSGHSYALARAMSYTDDKKRLGQHFGGVDYYRFVCELLKDWTEVSRDLPAKLTDVCKRTFKRGNDYHSFTGPKCDLAAYWDKAGTFGLEEAKAQQTRLVIPPAALVNEAFVVPTDVCFVSKALCGPLSGNTFSGTWNVAQKAINYEYLWNEIRVKGGAYGCGIKPDIDGEVGFYTFRDPNLDDSLARMDACASWIESYEPTEEDLEGYIVSTLAAHDSPKKPYQVARRQDGLYLARRDPLWRERLRNEELATTPQALRDLAQALHGVAEQGRICVFGSRDIIAKASADLTFVDLISKQ